MIDPATRSIIETFRRMYGNEAWTAGPGFLHETVRLALELPEPLVCVECGSGLTTLVLRDVLGKRLVSLEHDEAFARRTGASCVGIRDFGGYAWYDAGDRIPDGVGLVVCDGPPRICPGGRYGAMPRLHDRLAAGFSFVLDDINREEEKRVVERWATEFGPLRVRIGGEPDGRQFAVLRRAA